MKNRVPTPYRSLSRQFARTNLCKISALVLGLVGLPSAVLADATWVGGTSQDWNTGANWSVNPPTGNFIINTATAGVFPVISANSAFSPVDILVGVGVAGQIDQNAGTNSTGSGNWLVMGRNNGGAGTYNLNGGTLNAWAIHMNNNGTGSSTSTLNINGVVNVGAETVVNDGQGAAVSGTGTLNVNSGTLNTEGDLLLSFAGSGLGQVNIAAGATVNVATTTKRWCIISQWDTTRGDLNLNGGTLNLNANTDIQFSVGSYSPGASQGPSSVNLNSGVITSWSGNKTGAGSGVVNLNNNGTSTGISNVFNLNGGTLTISAIVSGQSAGTRLFNFNGGTLKPTASSATFFVSGAATAANVRNGGAIIDSNGKDITISQALQHSDIGGDAATDGGLTKTGNGTLTISGTLSYTGPTKVLGGILTLNAALGLPSGGDLVVSNATLNLNATSGALSANNVNAGPAATVNITASPSSAAISAAGSLNLGTNSVINLSYGTVAGNPTVAVITSSGSLTKGTNIVINISATGLGVGTVPLLAIGSGSVSTNGFTLGTLPSGVKGVLTNSTSSTLDLLITSAGQLLSWRGADALNNPLPNWNINTSSNWYDLASNLAKYLQYSGNTIGDNVVFGDNGFNTDGTNHVNLAVTVVPATVLFSSSSPYTVAGAGAIGGSTSLVLTNMYNSVFLATSNTYTGGTVVGSGTLIITNDNALGAAAGGVALGGGTLQLNAAIASSRPVTLIGNSTVGVVTGVVASLTGTISGGSSLTKNDNGILNLTAANSSYGATLVSAGTLNLIGTVTNTSATVGSAAGNAVLGISGNLTAQNLFVGNAPGAFGAVFQTAGTVTLAGGTGDLLNLGNSDGTYGYYKASGGTLNLNGISIGGENNPNVWPPAGNSAHGLMEVNGATINNDGWIVLARGGAGNNAVLNMFSGSLTYSGGGIGCNWELTGADQTSIINILGGSVTSTNQGVNFRTVNTGVLNLNGGLLKGTSVTGPGAVNFGGGRLQAAAASGDFLNVTRANVYANGGTIDDGGYLVTIGQPLLAPDGYGLSSIVLSDGGSGYISPPIVLISGGSGSNATVIASISGGVVTGLTVTSPGSGYSSGDSVGVSFIGGGATVVAPGVSSVVFTPNISGGLTKAGSGTLTLTGANTYTGTTLVTNGTLLLTPNQQSATPVVVANGATLGISTSSTTNGATIGNLTLGSTGAASLSFTYGIAGNPTNVALTAGAVTVNGGSSIKIGGVFAVGTFPLLKYSSLSSVPTLVAPRGTTATLANDTVNKILSVVVTATGGGIVWTGNTGLIPNLWDINVTTNWLTGATATTYQEPVVPGDTVSFTDSGSGTVLVSNTVSPANMIVSNSAVAYTFQGPAQIHSTLGLTKLGSGTLTLSQVGVYSGSTVISNGTVSLGANQTFANLSGSGTLATAAGSPLVTASSTTNSTFSGNLQGSLSVTKTGNGTLTLSGPASSTSGRLIVNGGTVNVAGGSTAFSSGVSRVGYLANSGNLTLTGGSLALGGELQVGGSDQNGTANNATGTVTVANATLSVAALTVARGNNNENTVSGTVTLNAGGTLNSEGDTLLGFAGNANLGKIVVNGGTLNVATATKRWLIMSQWDTSQSQLDVNSGQVNINANTDIRFAINGNTGINVINLNGGAITFYRDNHTNVGGTGVVDLHQGNGSTVDNTFNLNGGTLSVSGVLSANTAGSRTFNFNGGTLKAVTNNASFVNLGAGTAVANVRNAGAIIDSGGFNVTIPQVLQHSAIGGDDAIDGGLTKVGNGTLTLNGVNTYTGPTKVNGGVLAGTGTIPGALTNSATLAPGDGGIGALTVNGNLTLKAGSTNTFEIDGTTPANDSVIAGANVTYGGTLRIVPSGTLTIGQTFTLFSGAGAVNPGQFASIESTSPSLQFGFTNGVLTLLSTMATNPTNITATVSGNVLTLTWPADHTGWILQAQTNAVNPAGTWFDVAGSQAGNTSSININSANPAVFYRLRQP